MNDDPYGLRNADLGMPQQGESSGTSQDTETYNYFKSMFDSGNPALQKQALSDYYDYLSPQAVEQRDAEKSKQSFHALLMQSLSGGGGGGESIPSQSPMNSDNGLYGGGNNNRSNTMDPQGSFGLGAESGQLFGKGGLLGSGGLGEGLVMGITQPFRQGLINPIAYVAQPVIKTGSDVLAGKPLAPVGIDRRESLMKFKELTDDFQAGKITKEEYDRVQEDLRQTLKTDSEIASNSALANPENTLDKSKLTLVTQQEHDDYFADPLAGGLKAGVSMASYAIPGGGGAAKTALGKILTAALRSGTAGAAFGFGTSRPGEEMQGALEGFGTGSLSGGLFQGGSEVIKGIRNSSKVNPFRAIDDAAITPPSRDFGKELSKTGIKTQYDALGVKPQTVGESGTLDFVGNQEKAIKSFEKFLNEAKLPRNGKGLSKLPEYLGNKQGDLLSASKYTTSGDNVLQEATEKLLDLAPELSSGRARALLERRVVSFADNAGLKNGLTPTQSINNQFSLDVDALNSLKTGIYDQATRAMSKPTNDLGDQIAIALHDTVKGRLYNNVPGFREVNTAFSNLYNQNKNLVNAFAQSGQVSQVGKTDILNLIQRRALRGAGQAMEGVGNAGSAISNFNINLPPTSPLAESIGLTGRKLAPMIGQELRERNNTDSMNSNSGPMGYMDSGFDQGLPFRPQDSNTGMNSNKEDISKILSYGLLNGEIDSKTFSTLSSALGIKKDENINTSERKTLAQAKTGAESVILIANLLNNNPSLINESLNPLYFSRSGDAKQLDAAINSAAEMFGRIQSGGVITLTEETRFKREFVPVIGDDENTKRYKLQKMYEQFSYILGNQK